MKKCLYFSEGRNSYESQVNDMELINGMEQYCLFMYLESQWGNQRLSWDSNKSCLAFGGCWVTAVRIYHRLAVMHRMYTFGEVMHLWRVLIVGKQKHLYWRGRSISMFHPHMFTLYQECIYFCWRNSEFDLYQHEVQF